MYLYDSILVHMIRKATVTDINFIFEIYSSYCIDEKRVDHADYQYEIQKTGFLLGLNNKKTIKDLIKTADLFLVDDYNTKIRGYVIFNKEKDFKDDNFKIWLDISSKKRYYNDPSAISIYEIAINKEYKAKGVASELLIRSEQILKKKGIKIIYSIVTIAPLTNCPSLLFHHKNGFRRVAMGIPRTLFKLKNYSSILFEKPVGLRI